MRRRQWLGRRDGCRWVLDLDQRRGRAKIKNSSKLDQATAIVMLIAIFIRGFC
jgi:hypothetical protein